VVAAIDAKGVVWVVWTGERGPARGWWREGGGNRSSEPWRETCSCPGFYRFGPRSLRLQVDRLARVQHLALRCMAVQLGRSKSSRACIKGRGLICRQRRRLGWHPGKGAHLPPVPSRPPPPRPPPPRPPPLSRRLSSIQPPEGGRILFISDAYDATRDDALCYQVRYDVDGELLWDALWGEERNAGFLLEGEGGDHAQLDEGLG
jgi:hypothetical protein